MRTNGCLEVVGVGIGPGDVSEEALGLIREAAILAGGTRLLGFFPWSGAERIPILDPLSDVISRLRAGLEAGRKVVVLAGGDPLFFGIGRRLIQEFGPGAVRFHPNVTALQAAAARMAIPWERIVVVSLHGRRDLWPLYRAVAGNATVAVYTDPRFGPARIASELIDRGATGLEMQVFEDLGGPEEQVRCLTLEAAAGRGFHPLNCLFLHRRIPPLAAPHLGMPDEAYRPENGLITKREIRAAALALLEILPGHTVWDLGAGCGSVALEAALLAFEGRVYAVEKAPERAALIRENIRRTGALGVEVRSGVMPGCLAALPDPDRIFLGGGIGRGDEVLEAACARLAPGGRLVAPLVLLGSLMRAKAWMESAGWPYSVTAVQASRSVPLAEDKRLEALNPVFLLTAEKPVGAGGLEEGEGACRGAKEVP